MNSFTLITSLKPYFQIQSYSEILGTRISVYNFGGRDIIQPIIEKERAKFVPPNVY